ncbi:MAG: NusG domain II-containing protein [Lachnospiraceae bacterium]|nr:NusG domain II-containing protein [Lachnospiraceae bacterium]
MKDRKMNLKFGKGDVIAIGIVLALTFLTAAGFHSGVQKQEANTLFIYQDGKLIKEMPLAQDAEFTVEGEYYNRIEIRNQEAGITQSSCPGTDCVHSGWIHEAGRSIVCLPNRVELRVGGESEVDVIVK